MVKEQKNFFHIGIVFLILLGVTGIVLAFTDDTNPNEIVGIIKINNSPAPQGTNYSVSVVQGTNIGYYYNGSVDDENIFITGIGLYDTTDMLYFSTGDNFSVTVPGFSQNVTGTFALFPANGNQGTLTNLVNLSIYYPENLPPTTTFNSSSTNITSVNGWYNRSVNVTLFPIDNPRIVGSGIFATYYNISGTGQQSGTNFIVSTNGNNSITYYSVDNNGSVENTNTIYMNVDTIAPAVTIDPVTSPTNATTQIINGTITETGSGIATITVTGAGTVALSGSAYSASVPLSEGSNTIYVNATDNSSNRGTNSTTIVRDTTAPAITINAVTSPTNSASQMITGTYSETGSGIASIRVNGIVADLSGNNYSATATLSAGSNTIYVNATDNMSNFRSNSTTIVFDQTSPVISGIGNSTPTSSAVTITWTTDETATSVVKYGTVSGILNLNSSNSTLTTSHSISLSGLQTNTTYYFVVNSTDAAGNANQSLESNLRTMDAPTVIISSPSNTTYNTNSISLNSSFGGQTVSYAWYNVDGGANSTSSANAVYKNATLSISSDGWHNVTVYANDSSGNVGRASTNFSIDTTAPVMTIDPVTSPTNATSQLVNGTFVETGSGISVIIVGGVTATLSGNSYSVSVPLSSEGVNVVYVNGTDNVSNMGTNSTTIYRDTIAPVVTINTVTSPTNGTSQTISGTYTEAGSGIATILVNGVAATFSGGIYSASSISLVEGINTIYVNATDNASNIVSNTTTIRRDTIAPGVTINTVTTPTNGTSQTISGTYTESGSGIATIQVNGVTATFGGGIYSATSVPLVEGNNTIYVNATDNASNMIPNSTTIRRDTTAPVVSINTVTSPTNGTSQTISGTYTETGSGIASIEVNGVSATLGSNTTYSALVPLSLEGSNTIYVNATDNVSNTGTSNTAIVRDTTQPVISSVTNTTATSVSITITWTTNEAATSVVKYGTSSGSLGQNRSNSTLTTDHSVSITGLQTNTTYYYVVNSTDSVGNSNQSTTERSFTTLAAPTVTISSPIDTTYNSRTISLNASFGGQTVSYTWYNIDGGANSTTSTNTLYKNATLSISSDGRHNVTVFANDSAGITGQSTVNFTVDTTGPVISSVTNTSPTSNSTTITWSTDEAATSVVKYGTSSGDLDQNSNTSSLATSHSRTLSGLVQNTTYYYAVNGTDAWGNPNQSSVRSFTTEEVYGSVNGTLTDARLGTTIANVSLTLYNSSGGTYTATSDANGVYSISNLITKIDAPYVYVVYATKTNYKPASASVTVNASGVSTRNVQMTMYNGTFRGVVIKNGTSIGVGGARVNMTNATLGSVVVTTDASGMYSSSVYPAIYESITVSKIGYQSRTVSNENVSSNETHTVSTISLIPNTVTVTANRTSATAEPGQNASFNLTVVNTGEDATFSVSSQVSNTTIATYVLTPTPLLLNTATSTGYVIVEVNNSNYGGWPVTITISNSSQSKSASITLNAIMRNASAVYTNISSVVNNATVVNATLVNASVRNGATISGNSTLVMDANITGSSTSITDSAVIKGSFADSNIDNSSVGNATVDSSTLTGSTIRNNAFVINSTLTDATVSNSTLSNVRVERESTITNVANLSGITLGGVTIIGDPSFDYQGEIQAGSGWVTYQNINFTSIYTDILIPQLVIEQSPDQHIPPFANVSLNDSSLGTSMNFSMVINLSSPALINISETGINPEGSGPSSGTLIGRYLHIQSNTTNVTNNILRLYLDRNPLNYSGAVRIYYYNTSAATPAWESLNTTGNGTEGGRYYIEATPNHFSTFALLEATTTTTSTPTSGGSSGGSSSGTVSGGGAGGLLSGEKVSNIVIKENYDLMINKDKITTYRFKGAENPIAYINITGNVNAGLINTAAEVLKGRSTLVEGDAPGIVYKNVNIWVGTKGFVSTKNIQEAVVGFKVLNSWLTENGLDATQIRLVNLAGSNWVHLGTSIKNKDSTYTYFEARTDAFSHFAITGIKAEASTQTVIKPTPSQVTATPVPVKTEAPVEKKSNGFEALYLLAGILAVAYMLRRKN